MLGSMFSTPIRAALLLSVALAAGDCYATKFTLGPIDKARVDPAWCGKWLSQDGKTNITISNFNDREYLVQVIDEANKATPYAGFLVELKGVQFAHSGPLSNDGKPPEVWVIQRVELKDNQLVVRDLNKTFIEGKNPASADELRKLIEAHLNDDAIYEGGGTVMTRVEE